MHDRSLHNYESDWVSPETLVDALYETISADPGEKRDWVRFRALFFDNAEMLVAIKSSAFSGIIAADVETTIQNTEQMYGKTGFHEYELKKKIIRYGSLASVYSSFEIKYKNSDQKPLMKGLNHFQLLNDGERWWIISNTGIIDDKDYQVSEAF